MRRITIVGGGDTGGRTEQDRRAAVLGTAPRGSDAADPGTRRGTR